MTGVGDRGGYGPRTSLDRVHSALEQQGFRPNKQSHDFKAVCPCHDEKSGSLHVTWRSQPQGGRVLLKCFGCEASAEDIATALGLTVADLYDEPLPEQPRVGRSPRQRSQGKARTTAGRLPGRLTGSGRGAAPAEPETHTWVDVETYDYADADAVLVQQVVRRVCSSCPTPHKAFHQQFVGASGRTVERKPPGFVPVLYRLPEVRAAVAGGRAVYLVEGEKDVHTAERLGEVATTNPGGGGVFPDTMADELSGADMRVVLDRDDTGWARGMRLHKQLTDRGATVRLLLPAVAAAKADLTDHVEAGHALSELVEVRVDELRSWAALASVGKALRLVRESAAEARARLQLAEAATVPAQADTERGYARRWAAAAGTRWEALADDVATVVRLAEAAGGGWTEQAADLARSALRVGSTTAREVYELAGVELPGELRPEAAQAAGAAAGPAAAAEDPPRRRVRKLLPGQTRYEDVDNALYVMRSVKTGNRTDSDGGEAEVWEDKPKLILNLAPKIVRLLYPAPEDEAEQAPTRGRESRASAPQVRDAQMPTHVVFRYVHPVTEQAELIRVEHDAALDSSWLATLAIAGLDYDSSRNGRAKIWDAIRQTSPEAEAAVLYRATGWEELPEHGWGWVHAGGAITAKGNVAVPVRLTGTLARFDLPDPLTDAARLREVFLRDSLGMLDRLPERVAAVLIGHMFRAATQASPFSPVLLGVPGTMKTSVGSIAMHHYGEAWDRDRPATSMSGNGDTTNAMRWKLYKGKDGVTFCDDVAPTKDFTAAQKLLEEVGRMVHGKEGRTRLQRDGQESNAATPPRGSALFTSEVYPRPGSGAERLIAVPLSKGQIQRADLVALDEDASRHGRALVMSTFLSWLAADLPLQRALAKRYAEEYTQQLLDAGRENRLADAYGHLWAGWKLLTTCLVDVEALTSEERDRLLERVDAALDAAMTAAVDPDVPTSAGGRVREMIAWALGSGLAHVLDATTGECPQWPLGAQLGHRAVKPLGNTGSSAWHREAPERTEPRGLFAGYVVTSPRVTGGPREVLLDRLALEQIIKTTAGQLSDAPQMDGRTAMRALYDAGVLQAEVDGNGDPTHYAKWRTIDCLSDDGHKRRQRLVVLDLDKLLGEEPEDDRGPRPGEPAPPEQPTPAAAAGDGQPAPTDADGELPLAAAGEPPVDASAQQQAARTWTRRDGARCQPRAAADPEPCFGCQGPTVLLWDGEPWHPECWVHSDPCDPPAGYEAFALGHPLDPADEPPQAPGATDVDELQQTPLADVAATVQPAAVEAQPALGAPAAHQSDPEPAAAAIDDAPAQAPAVPPGVPAAASPGTADRRRQPEPARAGGQAAVAVVDVDRVVLGDGSSHPLLKPVEHLGHLAELAERFALRSTAARGHIEPGTVLVTDAMAAQMGLPVDQLPAGRSERRESWETLTEGHPALTEALRAGWTTGGTPATALRGWMRLQHPQRRTTVRIAFAALLQADGLVEHDPTPEQLARRLQLVADRLGYPWRVSATATGFDLLIGLRWKDRDRLFTPATQVPPAALFLEPDINWSRVPYREEQARRYLHVYDRGGSYAAGLAGLEVGIGEPVHHPQGVAFDKRVPGYYRVVVPEQGDLRMPHPVYVGPAGRRQDGTAWVTAPTVEFAAALDYPVEVVEAYVWPEHGRVFTSWYETLRDARTALDVDDVDAQAARDLIKDVYVRTIGMMGSHEHHAGRRGYAPDRRFAIIAKARSNLLRRVVQIGTDVDRWPVAISNDSVAFVSDDPDPITAWPGRPEHLGRGLGQYKHEYSGLLASQLPYLNGRDWKGKNDLVPTVQWAPDSPPEP